MSPTYVPDLANAVLDLLLDGAEGVWHLANDAAVSWYELAWRTAAHDRPGGCHGPHPGDAGRGARLARSRPAFSALGSGRGQMLGIAGRGDCALFAGSDND